MTLHELTAVVFVIASLGFFWLVLLTAASVVIFTTDLDSRIGENTWRK